MEPAGPARGDPRGRCRRYAKYVEQTEDILPALERAWRRVEEGMVGFLNVKTDYRARATTVQFSSRMT